MDNGSSEEDNVPNDKQTTNALHFLNRRDFYQIELDGNQCLYKKLVSEDRDGEPMFVNVRVNRVDVSMEIDTGTYATVISKKTLHDSLKRVKMNKTSENLRSYDSRTMHPVGKLSNLTVKFQGKSC